MINKKGVLLLLVLLATFSLFAAEYKIDNYNIEVDGVTRVSAIKKLIVPSYQEIFSNELELKSALDTKLLILNDTSLFKDVHYEYEVGRENNGVYLVDVTFFVVDANNFLVFPFPKYSTDNGLTLKTVVKQHNLFGTMATIDAYATASTRGGSIRDSLIEFSVPFQNLTIGDTGLSFELYGDLDLAEPPLTYIAFLGEANNLKFANLSMNASLAYITYPKNKGNSRLDFTSNISGFRFGKANLTIPKFNFSFAMAGEQKINNFETEAYFSGMKIKDIDVTTDVYAYNLISKTENKAVNLSASLSNIKYKEALISESQTFKFAGQSLKLYEFDNNLAVNLPNAGVSGIVLGNNYTRLIQSKTNINETYGTWKFPDQTWTGRISLAFTKVDKHKINKIDAVISTVRSHIAWNFLQLEPSFRFVNSFTRDEKLKTFKNTYGVHATLNASGTIGEIHKVMANQEYTAFRDNYREGFQFSMSGNVDWEIGHIPTYKVLASFTGFKMLGTLFNPNIRIGLSANSVTGTPYDVNNTIGGITFTYDWLKDYMRGITASNEKFQWQSGGVLAFANLNFTSAFINFEDFGHTYINPFMDVAIFADAYKLSKPTIYKTIGIEGIAILDGRPGYPVRASLALNFDDFVDKFIKKVPDVGLEYEIFIGLNWLY